MDNINLITVESTGKQITFDEFFRAYGYTPDSYIYIRTFFEDLLEKKRYEEEYVKEHGRKPSQNENYNPLKAKFNHRCKVSDFNEYTKNTLLKLNKNGYGVWFVVNGEGQKKVDVISGKKPKAQFMEIDDMSFDEQMNIINDFSLQPNIIIRTKKSLHCYWILKDGDYKLWREVQKRLIEHFNSDKQLKDENRVMRLPNFLHNKNKDNAVMCSLVRFEPDRKITQQELLDALPTKSMDTLELQREVDMKPVNTIIDASSVYCTTKEQLKSSKWLDMWLDSYGIEYEKNNYLIQGENKPVLRYELQNELDIPWNNEYTTPWNKGDTILMVRENGLICLSGRHNTDTSHSWKDFRLFYEPDIIVDSDADSITLDLTEKGKILKYLPNYINVLKQSNIFKDKIKYNLLSRKIMTYGSLPWMKEGEENVRPWNDTDTRCTRAILTKKYGLEKEKDLIDAIDIVAHENEINPLTDFLESLKYSGNGYIRKLLPEYLGCADSDYNYECIKLFMLGMVSRAYKPGCKFDYVLVLQGRQGGYKSTFFRLLAMDDSWFTDSIDSLSDRKVVGERIQGKWLAELPEMSAMSKSEAESIKAVITSTCDSFREAYGRSNKDFDRITVFAGTTNQQTFLKDSTGNRRFLIVKIEDQKRKKNLFDDECRADFERAWAEAVHLYKEITKDGKMCLLVLPKEYQGEAEEYQKEANEYEELTGVISCWLDEKIKEGSDSTCALDIWVNCLNQSKTISKADSRRINQVLDSLEEWQRMSTVRIHRVNTFGSIFNYQGRGYKFRNIPDRKECFKKGFRPPTEEENIIFG